MYTKHRSLNLPLHKKDSSRTDFLDTYHAAEIPLIFDPDATIGQTFREMKSLSNHNTK